jgi:hypothetical protein
MGRKMIDLPEEKLWIDIHSIRAAKRLQALLCKDDTPLWVTERFKRLRVKERRLSVHYAEIWGRPYVPKRYANIN